MLPDETFLRYPGRDGPPPELTLPSADTIARAIDNARVPRPQALWDAIVDQACRIHDLLEAERAIREGRRTPLGSLCRALGLRASSHGLWRIRNVLAPWIAVGDARPETERLHSRLRTALPEEALVLLDRLHHARFTSWEIVRRVEDAILVAPDAAAARGPRLDAMFPPLPVTERYVAGWVLDDGDGATVFGAVSSPSRVHAAVRSRTRAFRDRRSREQEAWDLLHLLISPRSPLSALAAWEPPEPSAPARGAGDASSTAAPAATSKPTSPPTVPPVGASTLATLRAMQAAKSKGTGRARTPEVRTVRVTAPRAAPDGFDDLEALLMQVAAGDGEAAEPADAPASGTNRAEDAATEADDEA